MSLFEFLMVLVSIIIGLGIAEVLTGIARLIRCRGSIQGYWIHSVLVTAIFLALLQQGWKIWGVRDAPEWTFLGLVMMLTGPVGLFLMAHLLFPEPMQGRESPGVLPRSHALNLVAGRPDRGPGDVVSAADFRAGFVLGR